MGKWNIQCIHKNNSQEQICLMAHYLQGQLMRWLKGISYVCTYDQYTIICYSVRTFQIATGTLLVAQSNCWSLIGQGWKDTSQF